jgi:hypothetical protein
MGRACNMNGDEKCIKILIGGHTKDLAIDGRESKG